MKKKLLLLHGALGTKNQFSDLKPILENNFELFDFNFEGHGGVETNKEYSIDLFVQNVIDFLQANNIESTNIFGYSMGGYVALSLATKHPAYINKIITLGTKFNWTPESSQNEVKMLDPDKIESKVPQFGEKLRKDHHPVDWKDMLNKTASMMISLGHGSRLKDEDFKKINLPVVIGIGSLDKMVSYEESVLVSSLIPNSEIIKLNDVKHELNKNDADLIATYINVNLGH